MIQHSDVNGYLEYQGLPLWRGEYPSESGLGEIDFFVDHAFVELFNIRFQF